MTLNAAAPRSIVSMLSTVRTRLTYRGAGTLLRDNASTLKFLSAISNDSNIRLLSTNSASIPFSPRRRASKEYRPVKPRPVKKKGPMDPYITENLLEKKVVLGEVEDATDELEETYGKMGADAIRHTIKEREERGGKPLDPEELLKMADYITTEAGSTEDLVGERRALALDLWDDEDRDEYIQEVDDFIEEQRIKQLGFDDSEAKYSYEEEKGAADEEYEEDPEEQRDINQIAFGDWGETIVRVDRVNKVQRGGTMVRYRCLVIAGNTKGCAGFGIGKAHSPREATDIALKMSKRNVFFVDRYQGSGLTRDLVGRHNSCKVILRSTQPNQGLNGHPLVMDILTYFGITDCLAKTHGNRNIYNVVRATFKAIMTHESMEEVALKRGKRLLNIERAQRLQI